MKKILTPARWLRAAAIILLICICLMLLLNRLTDPFFQFRVRNNSYLINPRYCSPGIVKNADYDALIIGSSMTQNFDRKLLSQLTGLNVLGASTPGMNARETAEYINLAEKTGKARSYYVCIDLVKFRLDEESKTPEYLLKDDLLSSLKYLLSYETWARFTPVDLAFSLLKAAGYEFDGKMALETDIATAGYWGDDYKYGEDVVLSDRKSGKYAVSKVESEHLLEDMLSNVDLFFSEIPEDLSGFNFFFPPYSAIFWSDVERDGNLEIFLEAKARFIETARARGAEVYNFQTEDFITDLSNYRDANHHRPEINDWMCRCFAENDRLVELYDYSEDLNRLSEHIKTIRDMYPGLL